MNSWRILRAFLGSDDLQLHLRLLVTLKPTFFIIILLHSHPIHALVTVPLSRLAPHSSCTPRWLSPDQRLGRRTSPISQGQARSNRLEVTD